MLQWAKRIPYAMNMANARALLAEFADAGVTITTLSEVDESIMREKAVEVWDELAAGDSLTADFMQLYKSTMTEFGY